MKLTFTQQERYAANLDITEKQFVMTVYGILIKNGCVLLIEDHKGHYQFPNTLAESNTGEAPTEAIIRAFIELVDIEICPSYLLGIKNDQLPLPSKYWKDIDASLFEDLHNYPTIQTVSLYYLVEPVDWTKWAPKMTDLILDAKFVDLPNFVNLDIPQPPLDIHKYIVSSLNYEK